MLSYDNQLLAGYSLNGVNLLNKDSAGAAIEALRAMAAVAIRETLTAMFKLCHLINNYEMAVGECIHPPRSNPYETTFLIH